MIFIDEVYYSVQDIAHEEKVRSINPLHFRVSLPGCDRVTNLIIVSLVFSWTRYKPAPGADRRPDGWCSILEAGRT